MSKWTSKALYLAQCEKNFRSAANAVDAARRAKRGGIVVAETRLTAAEDALREARGYLQNPFVRGVGRLGFTDGGTIYGNTIRFPDGTWAKL